MDHAAGLVALPRRARLRRPRRAAGRRRAGRAAGVGRARRLPAGQRDRRAGRPRPGAGGPRLGDGHPRRPARRPGPVQPSTGRAGAGWTTRSPRPPPSTASRRPLRSTRRYADATGLDLGDDAWALDGWYGAFACFKIAVICEGIHYRHVHGLTVGEGFDRIGALVPEIVRRGLDALGAGTSLTRGEPMDFAFDQRTEQLRTELLAFMDEHVYPAEPEFERSRPRAAVLLGAPEDHGRAAGRGPPARAVEPVPARPGARRGPDEPAVRPAGRDHRAQPARRPRGAELQRAGHREHGAAAPARHARAAGAVAGAAAGGPDPLGFLHDRARRRLVRRVEHRAADDAHRRRRVRPERAQVVDDGRALAATSRCCS